LDRVFAEHGVTKLTKFTTWLYFRFYPPVVKSAPGIQ
jgi:hypothetical protein